MAQIITAKSAGFCFGVKRAVETVYEEIEKGGPIYTYGPIIHNEEVVADLEKKGVRVIMSDDDLANIHGGTIITRSHGISREEEEKLSKYYNDSLYFFISFGKMTRTYCFFII